MSENICRFIPLGNRTDSVQTLNFVLETERQIYSGLKSEALYKMYYVCSGSGLLHTAGRITPVSGGTVFFTFPGFPFALESSKDFTYMYIGFVGLRGNKIMESLKIGPESFVFPGCEAVNHV